MQVVEGTTIQAATFANHRGDGISFQRLLKGRPGTLDNFELSLVHFDAEYSTPRHHHNFDQLHYVLEGTHEYAPRQHMPAGTVTYFPEGAHYGPQTGHGAVVVGLQFAGASGSGFMSYDQLSEGNKRLSERGSFENGIFRYVDGDGRHHNKDGYEAIWEEVNGKPVAYPGPRYHQPIVMRPENYSWITNEAEPGVSVKTLGCFTERRTTVSLLRLEPSAAHRVAPRRATELYFVVSGEISCGDGKYGQHAAFMFEPNDTADVTAVSETELYAIRLPEFA